MGSSMPDIQKRSLERQYQMGRQQLIDTIVPLVRQEPDPEDEVRPQTMTPEIFEGLHLVLRTMDRAANEAFSIYIAPHIRANEGEKPDPSDDCYFAVMMIRAIQHALLEFEATREFWMAKNTLLTSFLLYGAITALPEALFTPEENEPE